MAAVIGTGATHPWPPPSCRTGFLKLPSEDHGDGVPSAVLAMKKELLHVKHMSNMSVLDRTSDDPSSGAGRRK